MVSQEENSEQKTSDNKDLSYMLFAFGALLLVVGIYLSTYTTVTIVNKPINDFGYIVNIPTAQQIQPYLPIGILAILSALVLIGIVLYKVKKIV